MAGLPPSIKFTSTHTYTWVERGTVRVKWFAEKHNTMSPAMTRNWTVRSSVKRINHEATVPPTMTSALGFYICLAFVYPL